MYNPGKLVCGYPTIRRLVFTVLLAVLLLPTCFSAEIINTGGFESYSVGNLEGQFQPVATTTPRDWKHASNVSAGTAVVGSNVGLSNSKGVQVDRGANSDDRWAVPVGGLGFPSYGNILVDWDMKVMGTGSSTAFGPFLGVDTYDDTGTPPGAPRVLGSLGVDATTGDVLYQLQGSGILAETGASVTFGQWHHFQIRLDFVLDNYKVFVDGVQKGSQGFVDGVSSMFTDADIASFAAAPDAISQGQTATAFFDNFVVRNYRPGDFDDDGDVDGHDFLVWQRGGSPNPLSATDLNQWQSNYGIPPLVASAAAVPEPAIGGLISMALLCLLGQNRGKRTR
ncbi:hypothetical protein [Bythopirellula polymerisocia]|uniref:PEP-CTERM protein-sorting domain-containing protein n=1 Tax=Bythopirellula polymerisocia TaxID=2528003 RepID=A0A5C6CMY0_9BACT|nr:hypothetical protein [Bythopirellula polymerisocia]TWU25778.1 hypothetical protein Pla144_29900 [Bythopirellula polymerisocia]